MRQGGGETCDGKSEKPEPAIFASVVVRPFGENRPRETPHAKKTVRTTITKPAMAALTGER